MVHCPRSHAFFLHCRFPYDDLIRAFDELVPVAATVEWALPSEPWVFVIDDTGVVSARFEGAASDNELRSAFVDVSS